MFSMPFDLATGRRLRPDTFGDRFKTEGPPKKTDPEVALPEKAKTFISSWSSEVLSWERLARTAYNVCEEGFGKRLDAQFSWRVKTADSIEKKLVRNEKKECDKADEEKREYKSKLTSNAEIEKSMHDLAGIRICLPYPDDAREVQAFLEQEFGKENLESTFWGLDDQGKAIEKPAKGRAVLKSGERFLGYRATHFLLTWQQPKSEFKCKIETDDYNTGKTVEIQVTTILMNGWQVAQHDLIYKELKGTPSDDERALLAMINGLAHAGEVALYQLQKIYKKRAAEDIRRFRNHHELSLWLDNFGGDWWRERISREVDHLPEFVLSFAHSETLFRIMMILGICTPDSLRKALTGNFQSTALANDESFASFRTFLEPVHMNALFRWDVSLWAIIKICTQLDFWGSNWTLDLRSKAFIIVNAMFLADSGVIWRSLDSHFGMNKHHERALLKTMLILRGAMHAREADARDIEILWESLTNLKNKDLSHYYLFASMALLGSRIALLDNTLMMTKSECRRICWPGDLNKLGSLENRRSIKLVTSVVSKNQNVGEDDRIDEAVVELFRPRIYTEAMQFTNFECLREGGFTKTDIGPLYLRSKREVLHRN